MTKTSIEREYEQLKRLAKTDMKGVAVAEKLCSIATQTVGFLETLEKIELQSQVNYKRYFAFPAAVDGKHLSRAVNTELYDPESLIHVDAFLRDTLSELDPGIRSRLLYTVASSFMCTIDVFKRGDQKTPATYFEILIGHLLSRALNVNPTTQVEIPTYGTDTVVKLPTDFIFDLGRDKRKFHVPVKTSTRERAIQVFAHQRVLDGMLGQGSFRGLLVCFAETKLDHDKEEVVEICLPDQWSVYQRYIAPLTRFYYFDVPGKYRALNDGLAPMAVKDFAEFFDEIPMLVHGV